MHIASGAPGTLVLLPRDPDASARRLRAALPDRPAVVTELRAAFNRHSLDVAGFRHAEHMCVVFKREVGQTPGAYHRQCRG